MLFLFFDTFSSSPQGITLLTEDLLLITLYREFHLGFKKPSLFAILNRTITDPNAEVLSEHSIVAVFELKLGDGSDFYGHVGGVTVTDDYVFTVDDYQLYGFKKGEILDSLRNNEEHTVVKELGVKIHEYVDAKASFVYHESESNVLWIGDFYEPGGIFSIPKWHESGWVAGYQLDGDSNLLASVRYNVGHSNYQVLKPDTAIFIKQGVQGFFLCEDVVGVSLAFGLYDSTLEIYTNPITRKEKTEAVTLPNGDILEVYKIGSSPSKSLKLPTGSEDLDCKCGSKKHEVAVLFESASYIYKFPIRVAGGNVDDRAFTFFV